MRTENFSPLDPIQAVLLGGPGTEAVLGLIMPPELSLFEPVESGSVTSVVEARADHSRMIENFTDQGIEVFNMRKIIGEVLAERANHRFTSKSKLIKELKRRAEILNKTYQMETPFEHTALELELLLERDIQEMGLDAAIAINGVLTNVIDISGKEKEFDPMEPPAANFMFWRDTNHISGDQLITHRMHFAIRDQEIALANLGMEELGINYQAIDINPNTVIKKSGEYDISTNDISIEGGDILPMELDGDRYAVIGSAERTSFEAVKAWYRMHEALFSQSGEGLIPLLVQGPDHDTQDEMHVDTFAQQIAPGAIVHCREITAARDVYVLMKKGDEIIKVKPEDITDGTFASWIEKRAANVFNMTKDAQLNYAPNVLVHGKEEGGTQVFITRDGTPEVTEFIKEHADTILLRMNELTKLYGGAHCATSEIR